MKLFIIFSLMTGVCTMMFFKAASSALSVLDPGQAAQTASSPQFTDGKFKTNAEPFRFSMADIASTTWDYLFGGQNRTPDATLPSKPIDVSPFKDSAGHQLNATWLGHSSLMINIDGYRILADPVFEKRISVLGPARFNGEVPLI